MQDILTRVFGIISAVGVVLTIYYGIKSAKLERKRKTLEWSDILMAADDLAKAIKRTKFIPEVIFSPSVRGGIVAELVSQSLHLSTPVILGFSEWKYGELFDGDLTAYDSFDTSRWTVHLPRMLYCNVDRRILIVDDLAMSGDALAQIKLKLEENGCPKDNIKTATVVASKISGQNHKAPDHCWMETESTDFFFPWGKTR